MKVVAFNGSPHRNGNTTLLRTALEALEREGSPPSWSSSAGADAIHAFDRDPVEARPVHPSPRRARESELTTRRKW